MPGCHDSAILARFLRVQLCHLLSFFRKRNGKWCDTDFADRHVCGLDSLLLLGSRKNSKTFNNNSEKSNKNFCFSCWVLCEWDEVGRPKRPPSQGKKQQQNLRVFLRIYRALWADEVTHWIWKQPNLHSPAVPYCFLLLLSFIRQLEKWIKMGNISKEIKDAQPVANVEKVRWLFQSSWSQLWRRSPRSTLDLQQADHFLFTRNQKNKMCSMFTFEKKKRFVLFYKRSSS